MEKKAQPQVNLPSNFIKDKILEDIKNNKNGGRVATRFPPEPNGYLHIGHAKSIVINFGLAQEFNGTCNLRFDDTNPSTEDIEFINSIQEDIKWLGFDWEDRLYYASDYFDIFYQCALKLIKDGKAYVCHLNAEQIREYRGTLTQPGKESPYRNRSIEENLDLFEKMKNGEFEDGTCVLRAKIDMASPNLNMRDPVIYRIKKSPPHPKTKDKWCIYPMYDFAHCISDAIEKITHSICTLEFEDHRPLYDWFLDQLDFECHPQQIEFARLNLNFTVTSKRKLKELVEGGYVNGWDDPRLPTLVALRRRGIPPQAIINFCEKTGVTKSEGYVEMSLLEHCTREYLEAHAPRAMCVLKPLKIVLTNYPDDKVEMLEVPNHPSNPEMGTRQMPFSKVLYIEQEDFMENPPKDFYRLSLGKEVRLRYAYIIRCEEVIKDSFGNVVELRCTYDPETLGKNPQDGRKIKGIIHWVSVPHALKAQVRLYDRLFVVPNPSADPTRDYKEFLNPDSLKIIDNAYVEPSLQLAKPEDRFQFERLGYFCADRHDFSSSSLVFNRIVSLKNSWAKIEEKYQNQQYQEPED